MTDPNTPPREPRYNKKYGYKEIPIGGMITDFMSSEEYKSGDWRTFRPIHIPEKCTHCMICWTLCPDSSIITKEAKFIEFDYYHCKGCGICAKECPFKAIDMKDEKEFRD
ncbi:4Fe-4S binding protein [Candidatus Woesearchaeota archaeon]|nr:4Fe-4S binding protein [Candidatus Woesearchaeota archaeon]